VLRCFDDDDIQHVMAGVDPVRDREIVKTELSLADLANVEKRLDKAQRAARTGDAEARTELALLERLHVALGRGDPARTVTPTEDERAFYRRLTLLTAKPTLFAANVAETDLATGNEYVEQLRAALAAEGEMAEVVVFSAKVEAELVELPVEDRAAFLTSLGVNESGLDRLARAAYHLLGLQSFFTAGEKEIRAWTVRRGARSPEAAGVIHSDFARGFIRAETVGYDDFIAAAGWKGARERGLVRAEGKDYVVQDGDVMLFRFNA